MFVISSIRTYDGFFLVCCSVSDDDTILHSVTFDGRPDVAGRSDVKFSEMQNLTSGRPSTSGRQRQPTHQVIVVVAFVSLSLNSSSSSSKGSSKGSSYII